MKKIISALLMSSILMSSTVGVFASNTYSVQVSDKINPSIVTNKRATEEDNFKIKSEIDKLKNFPVDTSVIQKINITPSGNEYIMNYGDIQEKIRIKFSDNKELTIIASNGEVSNEISFINDGSIVIDGNKIEASKAEEINTYTDISPFATVWKSEKSLSPKKGLTAASYNKYLSSGKQNIQLGKSIDNLTVSALVGIIGALYNPLTGMAVSLVTDAIASVYQVIKAINPKTEYLGCRYTTYTSGTTDYKYINRFYSNVEATGKYSERVSYEHFIIY